MSKTTKALAALGVVAGLGVAALPLSTYAAIDSDTADMGVDAVVENFISIENTTGTAEDRVVHLGTLVNNAAIVSKNGTVNVKTNGANGFTLKIKPTAAGNADMVIDGGTSGAKIPAGTPTPGTSAWGFKLDGTDTWMSFTGENVTEATLKADYALPADKGGTDITVNFGATVDGAQPAGTYKTSVTFTAATNPNA